MTIDDPIAQEKKLKQIQYDLKRGNDPDSQRYQAEVKKYHDQYPRLRAQKEAAIEECRKRHLTNESTNPEYEECVRQVEERYKSQSEAAKTEAQSLWQAWQDRKMAKQKEIGEQLKAIEPLAVQARMAQQQQAMNERIARANAEAAEKQAAQLADQFRNLPIETIQNVAQSMSHFPPNVQDVIRERLAAEGHDTISIQDADSDLQTSASIDIEYESIPSQQVEQDTTQSQMMDAEIEAQPSSQSALHWEPEPAVDGIDGLTLEDWEGIPWHTISEKGKAAGEFILKKAKDMAMDEAIKRAGWPGLPVPGKILMDCLKSIPMGGGTQKDLIPDIYQKYLRARLAEKYTPEEIAAFDQFTEKFFSDQTIIDKLGILLEENSPRGYLHKRK
jgi:hypothetical protein